MKQAKAMALAKLRIFKDLKDFHVYVDPTVATITHSPLDLHELHAFLASPPSPPPPASSSSSSNPPAPPASSNYPLHLVLQLPTNYPFKPPNLKLQPPIIQHPHVDPQHGDVCLNLVKNEWAPTHTIADVVQALIRLLRIPITVTTTATVSKGDVIPRNVEDAQLRILKELKDFPLALTGGLDPDSTIATITHSPFDLYRLHAFLVGPSSPTSSSPSSGLAKKTFHLVLRLPLDYPSIPPTAQFEPPIQHPLVDLQGFIRLDLTWSPSSTIAQLVQAIFLTLHEPQHPSREPTGSPECSGPRDKAHFASKRAAQAFGSPSTNKAVASPKWDGPPKEEKENTTFTGYSTPLKGEDELEVLSKCNTLPADEEDKKNPQAFPNCSICSCIFWSRFKVSIQHKASIRNSKFKC